MAVLPSRRVRLSRPPLSFLSHIQFLPIERLKPVIAKYGDGTKRGTVRA